MKIDRELFFIARERLRVLHARMTASYGPLLQGNYAIGEDECCPSVFVNENVDFISETKNEVIDKAVAYLLSQKDKVE